MMFEVTPITELVKTHEGIERAFSGYNIDLLNQSMEQAYSKFKSNKHIVLDLKWALPHAILVEAIACALLTDSTLETAVSFSTKEYAGYSDLSDDLIKRYMIEHKDLYHKLNQNMASSFKPLMELEVAGYVLQHFKQDKSTGIMMIPDLFTDKYVIDFKSNANVTKQVFRMAYYQVLYYAIQLQVPEAFVYFANYDYLLKIRNDVKRV